MKCDLYHEDAASADEALDPAAIPRTPGILIVDDMGLVLTLLKSVLESLGFAVWQAMNGDDGLDLHRRKRTEIDVVLLDVQMPGLDGPHTFNAIRRLNPNVLACLMTRHPGSYTRADLLESGAVHVFEKPFRATEVAKMLDDFVHTSCHTAYSGRATQPRSRSHAITQTH